MMDSMQDSLPVVNLSSSRSVHRIQSDDRRKSQPFKPSQFLPQASIQSQQIMLFQRNKLASIENYSTPPDSNQRFNAQEDEIKSQIISLNNTVESSPPLCPQQNTLQNAQSNYLQIEETKENIYSAQMSPCSSNHRIVAQRKLSHINGLNSPFQRLGSMKGTLIQKCTIQSDDKKSQKQQNDGSNSPQVIKDDKFTNLLKYIRLNPIMQRIVNRLESRKRKLLKNQHLYFLNDLATVNSSSQNEEKKCKIMLIFSFFLSYIKFPIINPANYYKIAWDILNIFSIFVMIFFIPIVLGFQKPINQLTHEWFILLIQFITLFEILISFNTAYYQKGIVVQDRFKISLNYLGKQFMVDIISFVDVIILYFTEEFYYYHFILLFYLMKMTNVSTLSKKLEEAFNFSSSTSHLFQLLRLLLTVLLISHLFACLWIFIMTYQKSIDQSTITWLENIHITHESWNVKYLMAIYYCTVTMVTVGYGNHIQFKWNFFKGCQLLLLQLLIIFQYLFNKNQKGDITPHTKLEYLLSIFTILIACGVFGYSLNILGKIFQSLQEQQYYIKKNMGIINQYMQKKNVSNSLKYQVREYLEYIWKESQIGQMREENRIIKSLSESLQQDLLYEANKIVLDDFPLFKKNFSPQCLAKMVPLIIENRFSPEELIITKDVEDDCSIYFIESGQVEICIFNSNKQKVTNKITSLKKGQCFGFQSFLTGERRTITIRSLDFTSLLQIKRKDFFDMIINFEEDYERFCVLKDSALNEQKQQILCLPCLCCGQIDHIIDECYYIHYTPNSQKYNFQFKFISREINYNYINRIIGTFSQNFQQKRDKYKRSFSKSTTLATFQDNYESLVRFHNENYDEIIIYIDEFGIFQETEIGKNYIKYLLSQQQNIIYQLDDIISQFSQQQMDKLGYNIEKIIEYSSQDESSNSNDSSVNSEDLNKMQNFKIQLQRINQLTRTTFCDIPDDPPNQRLNKLPHETIEKKNIDFQCSKKRKRTSLDKKTTSKQKQIQQNLQTLNLDVFKERDKRKKLSRLIQQEEAQSPLSPFKQKYKKSQNDSKITQTQQIHKNHLTDNNSSFDKGVLDSLRTPTQKIPNDRYPARSNTKLLTQNSQQTIAHGRNEHDRKQSHSNSENQNKKSLSPNNRPLSIKLISEFPTHFENNSQSEIRSRESIKKIQIQHEYIDQYNKLQVSHNQQDVFGQESEVKNLFFYDFESQKNYKKYFFKFNMNEVVERYRAKQEKIEKMKKKKMMNHLQKNIKNILRQQQNSHSQSQQLNIGQSQLLTRRKDTQPSLSTNDLVNSNQNINQLPLSE